MRKREGEEKETEEGPEGEKLKELAYLIIGVW